MSMISYHFTKLFVCSSTSLPSVINPEGAAKVFRDQGDSLKLVVQNDLTSVASKLYSKSIITADARKKAMNQMHLDSDRAVSLLGVVEDRIRDEPRVFTEFVKILESDTVTRSAADKLVKMYCQGKTIFIVPGPIKPLARGVL